MKQNEAREGLEKNDQPFRTVFECAPDAIFIEGLDGIVLECNPAAATLHCTTRERLIGRHASELVPPGYRNQVVVYSSSSQTPSEFESFSYTDTGASVPVSIRISRIEFRGQPALQFHVREITQQKRAQEEMRRYSAELEERVSHRTAALERANNILRQEIQERNAAQDQHRRLEEEIRTVQKMEAIGRLAGGVAHDFNNLLTVIIGRCGLLLDKTDSRQPMYSHLLLIRDSAIKAASVTRQLLALGRKQILEAKEFDLNVVVRNMQTLLHSLITETVEFELNLHTTPCGIEADVGQVEQVITNLVVNALDAMPGGGRLTIETRQLDVLDLPSTSQIAAERGRYIALSVIDTGQGMDSETLSRAFEPFFTTKDAMKGTGLGLSTVYGIVRQSGGHISASSEPGKGTNVTVYLPEVMLEEVPVSAKLEEPRVGSETILLVEDSDVVRELTREILQARGYKVIEAHDGAEALQICKTRQEIIHLTLSDVVMPRMNGREFAEQASTLLPEMKILLMSGYSAEVMQGGILIPGVHFIQKPFTSRELATKLRGILD